MLDPGNANIVILNAELQRIFGVYVIYKPEFIGLCLDHLQNAPPEQIMQLQSDTIEKLLYVKSPDDLIYDNPSSLFWVHPEINYLLNKNKKLYHTFHDLKSIFMDFITSNPYHVSRITDSIFYIHPHSELKKVLKFSYFHVNQVGDILKNASKYLGKTMSLETSCSYLKFETFSTPVLKIIETMIDTSQINVSSHIRLYQ
jgi:hypothetical protein